MQIRNTRVDEWNLFKYNGTRFMVLKRLCEIGLIGDETLVEALPIALLNENRGGTLQAFSTCVSDVCLYCSLPTL